MCAGAKGSKELMNQVQRQRECGLKLYQKVIDASAAGSKAGVSNKTRKLTVSKLYAKALEVVCVRYVNRALLSMHQHR